MTPPSAYPGRDNARILRRARSIHRSERESFNMRANCCRKPKHRELADVPAFTTRCENCGAVV